jgi:hypothetical protein
LDYKLHPKKALLSIGIDVTRLGVGYCGYHGHCIKLSFYPTFIE